MNVSPLKNQAESKASRRAQLVEELEGPSSTSAFLLTAGAGGSSSELFSELKEHNDKLLKQIHSVEKLIPKKAVPVAEESEEELKESMPRKSSHRSSASTDKKEEKAEARRSSRQSSGNSRPSEALKRRSSHRRLVVKDKEGTPSSSSPRRKEETATSSRRKDLVPSTDRLKGMRRCQTVDTPPTSTPPKSMRRCQTTDETNNGGRRKKQPTESNAAATGTLEESAHAKGRRSGNRRSRSRRSIHQGGADNGNEELSPVPRHSSSAKRTGRKQGGDVRNSQIHQALKLQELQKKFPEDEEDVIQEEQEEEEQEPKQDESERKVEEDASESHSQDFSDRSSSRGCSPRRTSSMLPSLPRISFGLSSSSDNNNKKEGGRQSKFLSTMSSLVPQLPGTNYGRMDEETDDEEDLKYVFDKDESMTTGALDESAASSSKQHHQQEDGSSRNSGSASMLESVTSIDQQGKDNEDSVKGGEECLESTTGHGRISEERRRQRQRRGHAPRKGKPSSPRRQDSNRRRVKSAGTEQKLDGDVLSQ